MEEQTFFEKYVSQLNEQQQEAVRAVDGAILILAVPGSGKTTVLVTRLGYMVLCKGISPGLILTLTYTRAATGDMKSRFASLFGEEVARQLEFRTINGICSKLLQYFKVRTGREPFSLLTDEKETGRLLAEILSRELSEYPTESEISQVRTEIAFCKNMMLEDEEIAARGTRIRIDGLLSIYKQYNDYLVQNRWMDYDDQMVYAYRILRSRPDILAHYREVFRYICVDEAQDTSRIQHEIIKLLAGEDGNLFMVGDEDQSIYGFRAAYPDALLHFEEDHPGARVLVMDKNYRSREQIVRSADALIRHNADRHEKSMFATRGEGADICYIELNSRKNQAGYLLKAARDCRVQTAVLYRDNESVLPLLDLLDRQGIPYRLKAGEAGFFTSRVVTDIKNTLLFCLNPQDSELFMKIYFRFNLYLSKADAQRLCRISQRKNLPVLAALEALDGMNRRVLANCRGFRTHLTNMQKEAPAKAIRRICKFMGYGEYMESRGYDEGKAETLEMLASREETIPGFLNRLEELQEVFRQQGDREALFILSTIHSAKGLEYDTVYLMDVCDGILPPEPSGSFSVKEKQRMLEEERRLFYVGMTRAKEKLSIFTFRNESSRFVRETKAPAKRQSGRNAQSMASAHGMATAYGMASAHGVASAPAFGVSRDSVPDPVIGMRVCHQRFGEGTLVDAVYEGEAPKNIEVEFEDGTTKKFAFPQVFLMGLIRIIM